MTFLKTHGLWLKVSNTAVRYILSFFLFKFLHFLSVLKSKFFQIVQAQKQEKKLECNGSTIFKF